MKVYQALGKKLHALAGDVSFLKEKKITGIKLHDWITKKQCIVSLTTPYVYNINITRTLRDNQFSNWIKLSFYKKI